MECLVYIQVLGTDMKIHPRTGCSTMAIIVYTIGFGLARIFNWDGGKIGCILIIICTVIHIPLYDYLHDEYSANDNIPKENSEVDKGVYIKVYEKNDVNDTNMKIRLRLSSVFIGIITGLIGLILAKIVNWNYYKLMIVLVILYLLIILPIHSIVNHMYYNKKDNDISEEENTKDKKDNNYTKRDR